MTTNLSVSLDLQECLVFGELRAFVEAAAGLGAKHDTTVELLELDNHDVGIVGLKVLADDAVLSAPTRGGETVVIDRRTIGDLLDVLTAITEECGDARKSLADVEELRGALEDALVAP